MASLKTDRERLIKEREATLREYSDYSSYTEYPYSCIYTMGRTKIASDTINWVRAIFFLFVVFYAGTVILIGEWNMWSIINVISALAVVFNPIYY